jgi:hypothetical protein
MRVDRETATNRHGFRRRGGQGADGSLAQPGATYSVVSVRCGSERRRLRLLRLHGCSAHAFSRDSGSPLLVVNPCRQTRHGIYWGWRVGKQDNSISAHGALNGGIRTQPRDLAFSLFSADRVSIRDIQVVSLGRKTSIRKSTSLHRQAGHWPRRPACVRA